MEAVFVCFTVINAAAEQAAIPPDWRRAVADLARTLATDQDWSHLDRDWTADQEAFDELRANVIGADGIDEALNEHPNSARNIRRRQSQSLESPDSSIGPTNDRS
jgi:hypothetical protein